MHQLISHCLISLDPCYLTLFAVINDIFFQVEKGPLEDSVQWLMSLQQEDGCFEKQGYVHSSSLQGEIEVQFMVFKVLNLQTN